MGGDGSVDKRIWVLELREHHKTIEIHPKMIKTSAEMAFFLKLSHFISVASFFSSECQTYQSLNNATRKITYNTFHRYCDNTLTSGWYRFEEAAGTRMATSCTPGGRCGTHGTSWLENGHPSVADGEVSRRVCFSWSGNCCYTSVSSIKVRNCGSYYIYHLIGFGGCYFRYCGTN